MHLWRAGELITAEKLTPKILAGAEYMTLTQSVSGYYRGERFVPFPDGFFTTAPTISLTARSGVPGVLVEVTYLDKSTAGFYLHIARQTQTETWVDWLAVQVPEL